MGHIKKLRFWILAAAALLAAWIIFAFARPMLPLGAHESLAQPTATTAVAMPWPAGIQGALGAQGFGVLATSSTQASVPMASVAKIVTALSVLKQKPLALNDQGPTITLTSADVGFYQSYVAQGGSVVKVTAGEQISEYQALQAMLLPSANNMAESLAVWAFGSMDAYLTFANQYIAGLGLVNTHMADASGFDPTTVSTAQDLVSLGLAALDNPVLTQIVGQAQAAVPVAGTVTNTNWLLGDDGVIGIKTGNTAQAGGCYLFAANRVISGRTVTVVGAVLGAPNLSQAIADGQALALASDSGFALDTAVTASQVVGSYQVPWVGKVNVVAKKAVQVLVWNGQKVTLKQTLNSQRAPTASGKQVGSISTSIDGQTASTSTVLSKAIPEPSWHWRLLHL